MHQHVLFPASKKGLNPQEHTLADHLKSQDYATACFGKWHLGHHPEVLPTSNGFDTYLGIPYSNDMNHPDNKGKPKGGWQGMDALWKDTTSTLTKWKTRLFENEKIVELPVDQRTVTRRYTQKAIDFVKEHRDESSSTCRIRCRTFLSMFRTTCAIPIQRTPTPTPLNTSTPRLDVCWMFSMN